MAASSKDSDGEGASAWADDSGHFSCSSDDSFRKEEPQHLSLVRVRQELNKTRSEMERLIKSEKWYKQELQTQKHQRLETLERLYAQERKYLQENQRLQQEARNLSNKCASLEEEARKALKGSPSEQELTEHENSFQLEQQQARLQDQRQLIEVLRKQKKLLLEDIQTLSLDHEEKLSHMQQSLTGLEMENKHMTGQFKKLHEEKTQLKYQLEVRESSLRAIQAEREQLHQVIAELNETLQTQEQLLTLKEQEFLELKQYYQQKLQKENSLDLMHLYSLRFHEEIHQKTSEIAKLKNALEQFQTEMQVMCHLKAQNEEQQRQLEKLEFNLKAQKREDEELRKNQTLKEEQLEQLGVDLSSLELERVKLKKIVSENQQQMKSMSNEILNLNQISQEMCQKYEETQTELICLRKQSSLNENVFQEQLKKYENNSKELTKALSLAETQLSDKLKQPELISRIESLEQQLKQMTLQKQQTVSLLQSLLQQQNAKIQNTEQMQSDWQQILQTLQTTQHSEQLMHQQMQEKTLELQQLNELFAQQNQELQQLQLLSLEKDQQNHQELQQLRETFQKNSEQHSRDAIQLKKLQTQVKTLLEDSDKHSLIQLLELETGRRFSHIKSWSHLIKLLRKELRTGRQSHRKAEELPALRLKLSEVTDLLEHAVSRIRLLEHKLNAERAKFETSDSGKFNNSQEPAHEVANLIDDYKKLIQQTAQETGRPRTSHILQLIELSQRSQPNLCQLSDELAACRTDMLKLNHLLQAAREPQSLVPSLMDELKAVTEQEA